MQCSLKAVDYRGGVDVVKEDLWRVGVTEEDKDNGTK